MKKLAVGCFALCLAAPAAVGATVMSAAASQATVAGGKIRIETDFEAAKARARKEGKPIFMLFFGSDWCSWSKRLDREVLSKYDFTEFAHKNLVFLLVDFPRYTAQPQQQRESNLRLARQYGVRGYPIALLTNDEGKVLLRTGYRRGGARAYVRYLRGFVPKHR